jgi:hypothetical protein
MGIATFVLSLAMKGGAYGRPVVYLGFATAVVDVIGSYPYAIGPVFTWSLRYSSRHGSSQ